ncbi:ATP-grasp domain-containing protein [Nocardia sp. NPDC047038]|uniref:ATP-grasp domain-containing protein n=1 Tax=Nocardia sp. NPDC047038 TaxID=3154338 RepID=UPI0033F3979F
MTRRVLVLGHSTGLIEALARIATDVPEVFLLVEPSVLEAHPGEFEHPVVTEIRTARFIFSDEAVEAGAAWHTEVGFDAVLPGKEHAVRAAAAIADKLGLGYPGVKAVQACTDKLIFRQLVNGAGFPTPRFRAVDTIAEVCEFFDACAGTPIVLKPRNRNGSLGVRFIDDRDDIPVAWDQSVQTDEGTFKPLDRSLEWTYLVEEYRSGPEFSVEVLVQAREIMFVNITGKTVGELPWFPEMAHQVPAVVPSPLHALLSSSTRRLVEALDVSEGLLHSEWRVHGGRAYPIECAVRFPGDRIPWLIELAYGVNLADAWLRCLTHTQPRIDAVAERCAAIRFLRAEPGVVTAVHGLEEFQTAHHVLEVSAPELGDLLPETRDSHSRPGFVVFDADTLEVLTSAATDFDAMVRVETRQP